MKVALQNHIDKNLPFLNNKKLLVAISGGIDSVVLTHLLYKLKFDITLAHCNFLLRGKESNKDEQFVKNLGERLQITTHTTQFETKNYAIKKGISTQMAARELRYNWFQKIQKTEQLDFIVTAHQKEDVIETFLINLTRGTGLDGLTGIPVINENIVRPFLPFSRNEIMVYAAKKKLQWREDQSNSSLKYVRNKIRHKVVPVLKELNPNLLDTFSNTLENLKGSQQIVADCIAQVRKKCTHKKEGNFYLDINKIKKLSVPKVYLFELLKEFGFTEWEDVTNLLETQSGKQLYSKTHRLLKDREFLIVAEIEKPAEKISFQIPENTSKINVPIPLEFEISTLTNNTKNYKNNLLEELIFEDQNTILLDANKISFPLTIRKWMKGDYFHPIGLQGKKKLSKFFKDEKLSLLEKENVWVMCSKNDIVWVIGKRMDDRFKVTPNTTKILKIKQ